MEVRPVERMGRVEPVGAGRLPGDVTPAVAVHGAERTEDDSYGSGAKRQERGLEDEDGDAVAAEETDRHDLDVMA